jgi:hypothetical protein
MNKFDKLYEKINDKEYLLEKKMREYEMDPKLLDAFWEVPVTGEMGKYINSIKRVYKELSGEDFSDEEILKYLCYEAYRIIIKKEKY